MSADRNSGQNRMDSSVPGPELCGEMPDPFGARSGLLN